MFLSVVIPTYNSVNLVKINLPQVTKALEQYDKNKVELIVTDDNSSDSTVAYLNEFKRRISIPMVILNNNRNGGFSVNINRGVRAAKGDIVILLGTDVQPDKDFIKPLLSRFADEKVFAVGCVNQSDQDKDTSVLRGRGIGRWEKGFLFHARGELINDETLWVDCGSGAFRRSTWNSIGGLQELYAPFYWEDVDLSYRAQKMGYAVKIEKDSRVIHEHEKGSIKKIKSDIVTQTAYRNQFLFVWLNITDSNLLLKHCLLIPYHLVSALKSGNWQFIKGFLAAVIKFNKVMTERKKIIPRFCVTDRTILAKFEKEIR